MDSLHLFKKQLKVKNIDKPALASIVYHSLFEYPLAVLEVDKWTAGPKTIEVVSKTYEVEYTSGYFMLAGKKKDLVKRLMRERESKKKMQIARKAAKLLSRIRTIKMVAVTGSLAMFNADEDDDIDLMIVTSSGALWTTRLISYLLLKLSGIKIRKPDQKEEKDMLCLNVWLDEGYMKWEKSNRNLYIAHEIAQVIPLVNKDKTYERFLWKNRWIEDYWPKAVSIKNAKVVERPVRVPVIFENFARKIQYLYMSEKRTIEFISKKKALFHPINLSDSVNAILTSR